MLTKGEEKETNNLGKPNGGEDLNNALFYNDREREKERMRSIIGTSGEERISTDSHLKIRYDPDVVINILEKLPLKVFRKTAKKLLIDCDLSPSIVEYILSRDMECYKYTSIEHRNDENAMQAVYYNPRFIPFMPSHLRSQEIFEKVIQENSDSFKYIPTESLTPDLCLLAVKSNSSWASSIPSHIEEGKNIYRFNTILEKLTAKTYSYDEVEAIYNGKAIDLPGKVENKPVKVVFDKDSFSFIPAERQTIKKGRTTKKTI